MYYMIYKPKYLLTLSKNGSLKMTRIHSLGYFKPKSGLPAQVVKMLKKWMQRKK